MKTIFVVGILCLAVINLCGQTNQIIPSNINSLRATLTNTSGKVYNSFKLIRVEPDGLVIEYIPEPRATGIAKVKFEMLSIELQHKYGYDSKAALAHTSAQAESERQLSQRMISQQEKAETVIRARDKENYEGRVAIQKMENENRLAEAKAAAEKAQADADRASAEADRRRDELNSRPIEVYSPVNVTIRRW